MNIQYSKHFLEQVIFQINFSSISQIKTAINFDLRDLITQLTGAVVNENTIQTIQFIASQPPIPIEASIQWLSKGNGLQIALQHDFLQIINFSYSNHKHFHGIIEALYSKVIGNYSPTVSRVALRYINQMKLDGSTFDLAGFINEDLTKSTSAFKTEGLTRSLGSMNMSDEENELVTTFTFGFYNSEFPNKIAKKEFLLDYDCATSPNSFNATSNEILPVLMKIKEKVNYLFSKSIEQKLKDIML